MPLAGATVESNVFGAVRLLHCRRGSATSKPNAGQLRVGPGELFSPTARGA
jgi:hypothetical protein